MRECYAGSHTSEETTRNCACWSECNPAACICPPMGDYQSSFEVKYAANQTKASAESDLESDICGCGCVCQLGVVSKDRAEGIADAVDIFGKFVDDVLGICQDA